MRRITVSLGIATICFALSGTAQAPNNPQGKSSTDIPHIAFEKYRLTNGLEVILSEDHRLPLTAVNLWYHVGPANEEPGRTGFAHLFEHMMFQDRRTSKPTSISATSKARAPAPSTAPRISIARTTSRRFPRISSSWHCGSSLIEWDI